MAKGFRFRCWVVVTTLGLSLGAAWPASAVEPAWHFTGSLHGYGYDTATLLKDGTALAEMPVGSQEWLTGEILSQRGESILLEPEEMRGALAARARELANELGVSRLRARA